MYVPPKKAKTATEPVATTLVSNPHPAACRAFTVGCQAVPLQTAAEPNICKYINTDSIKKEI